MDGSESDDALIIHQNPSHVDLSVGRLQFRLSKIKLLLDFIGGSVSVVVRFHLAVKDNGNRNLLWEPRGLLVCN